MKRGMKLALYLISILIIILAMFIFPQGNSQKSYFTSYLDEKKTTVNNSLEVGLTQLNEGSLVDIMNKTIKFNFGDKNLSINSVSSDSQNLEIVIGNEKINLENGKETKIDLDSDGIYDLLLISENNTDVNQLFIKSLDEKASANNLSRAMKQYNLIMIILVVLLIFLAYRTTREYIIPAIKRKRAKEIEKPSKVFDELYEEIKRTKDKSRQKELYSRMKNFYKYLDEENKEKLKGQLNSIENYIK